MATNQTRFCGILLQYLDGATWKTVGNVVEPQVPQQDRDEIDVTTTSSGSAGVCYRQQIPGVVNRINSATFSVNFDQDDSEHKAVVAMISSRVLMSWRLYDTPNTATIWQCDGFVSSLEFAMPQDAAQTVDVTIAFSGAPTTYGG